MISRSIENCQDSTERIYVYDCMYLTCASEVLVIQSSPNICDPMDGSPSGSSVHGILQVRILEWVAISFSRGSFLLRDWTFVSCIAGGFFIAWAIGETPAGGYTLRQTRLISTGNSIKNEKNKNTSSLQWPDGPGLTHKKESKQSYVSTASSTQLGGWTERKSENEGYF